MARYELLKFAVQATVLRRDEHGSIVGEDDLDPVAVYGTAGLFEYGVAVAEEIARANQALGEEAWRPTDPAHIRATEEMPAPLPSSDLDDALAEIAEDG